MVSILANWGGDKLLTAEAVRGGNRRYLVALSLLLTAAGLAIPFVQSLAAIIVLVTIANRINVAYPIVLVLGGMAIGFIPGVPTFPLPPELVLVVFLPPLLYWESVTAPTSARVICHTSTPPNNPDMPDMVFSSFRLRFAVRFPDRPPPRTTGWWGHS